MCRADAVNDDLRRYAVSAYAKLLDRKVLRDLLTQVVCWVLGEFGHLGNLSLEDLVDKMCELLERQYEQPETRSVILSAMLKLCARVGNGFYPPAVQEAVEKYQSSFTVDTQQRCYEFARLVADPQLLQDVLPADAFDEDLQVDKKLRFLDGFVDNAVANGGKRYVATAARNLAVPSERVRTLQFEAYERPTTTADLAGASFRAAQSENPAAAVDMAGPQTMAPMATTLPSGEGLFGTKAEIKWTEEGFVPEIRAAQVQQQKPAAPPSSVSTSSGSTSTTSTKRNSAREKQEEERTEKQKDAGMTHARAMCVCVFIDEFPCFSGSVSVRWWRRAQEKRREEEGPQEDVEEVFVVLIVVQARRGQAQARAQDTRRRRGGGGTREREQWRRHRLVWQHERVEQPRAPQQCVTGARSSWFAASLTRRWGVVARSGRSLWRWWKRWRRWGGDGGTESASVQRTRTGARTAVGWTGRSVRRPVVWRPAESALVVWRWRRSVAATPRRPWQQQQQQRQ